jgi:hypothetical protein
MDHVDRRIIHFLLSGSSQSLSSKPGYDVESKVA